ncbi:MAG: DUF898 family protein [Devosia sp.]|nr:DUF898 family protein [Devosia sp.]
MSVTTEGPWGIPQQSRTEVQFSGRRGELFGRLLRGYLLMLPTLGLYRFWLTTTKRRFYWQNTVIGGDRLEYTGSATQLLVGFLFALGVFLPIYLGFFYLSFQSGLVTAIGYGAAALLLWFLSGYAIYRGRDFRLSRTLWRGIRFDQRGSAWGYAVRRFLWSLLVLVTAGLAYPFMAGDLWRYRYAHTWFGDRQFSFTGSWKTVAGPFYRAWAVLAATIGLAIWGLVANVRSYAASDMGTAASFGMLATLGTVLAFVAAALCFLYYRSRETTRMFSAVRLGDAALAVKVKARSLLGQYLLYGLCLIAALIVLGILGFAIARAFNANLSGEFSAANIAKAGWTGLVLAAGGYLATLSAFTLLGEVFIDCGFWMLVSRHATIDNLESLDGVRATTEDKSLAGEGLADALNVGSF